MNDPDFPLDDKVREMADRFAAARAATQGKRAQPAKTWEETPIEDLSSTTPGRQLRRAWITEGKNGLGLRESEAQPIVQPSPSPGAWHN